MTRPLLPAILLAALLALGGCGGGDDSAAQFEGAERDVAQVIDDLRDAGQRDEPRRICEGLLSGELVERIRDADPNGDCTGAVDRALSRVDTFAVSVEDVRIEGDRARARVEAGVDQAQEQVFELVRGEDGWRIDGLPEG